MLSKSLVSLFIVFVFALKGCTGQERFHVNNFGAKADGIFDNTEAINACLTEALKRSNAVVVLGSGNYLCRGRLNIEFSRDNGITIEGIAGATNIEFTNQDLDKGIYVTSREKGFGKGSVLLRNFKIIGPKLGSGKSNKFYDTVRHLYGIGISHIREVEIDAVEVVGFYGNGIDISNKGSRADGANCPFQEVKIKNCSIKDVWGNSPSDSYGDGIYLSDCSRFLIANNTIKNRLDYTNSLGRAGIVIEDLTKNGVIRGNTISGYDRGIHIENSLGNITISSNTLLDNRISFYLWSTGREREEKAVIIKSNRFLSPSFHTYGDHVLLKNKDRAYIAVLREKPIAQRDKIEGNEFMLDADIPDRFHAIKGITGLSLLNNNFRKR